LSWPICNLQLKDKEAAVSLSIANRKLQDCNSPSLLHLIEPASRARKSLVLDQRLIHDAAEVRAYIRDSVVEAALAGIYRSKAENQAELVMPIWDGLTRTTSTETAANYAALILARAGRKEPLTWLPGMVVGGTVQRAGFRALAGWYYAKLKGQTGELLKYGLSD